MAVTAADPPRRLAHVSNQAADWAKHNSSDPNAKLVAEKIGAIPQSIWLTGDFDESSVKEQLSAANNEVVSFVVYAIPGRDNGNYSKGGFGGTAEYSKWVEKVARSLAGQHSIVILEPDAIGLATHLTDPTKKLERYQMLASASKALKKGPNTQVYVDVSIWMGAQNAAEGLKHSGIDVADGFCVNTSNFETTEKCITFGTEVSKLIGDKHFIIDTSRNGNGPWKAPAGEKEAWCNPPGRALGHKPTFDTGNPLVDAFLWVKRPGESDGACRGGPYAGGFWPEYAAELAKNTKW